MATNGLIIISICWLLQFCVMECRPESSSLSSSGAATRHSRSVGDAMVFPESDEDAQEGTGAAGLGMGRLFAPLQRQRQLSPTAPPTMNCRPVVTFRHPNGTIDHRYNDCGNGANPGIGNRFDGNDNTRAQVTPQTTEKQDHIVFPDDTHEPSCANGQRFCTADPSYPETQIDKLLQRVGNLDDLLQTDYNEVDLSHRLDVPGEETFCDYESRMEYPTKALSKDEKWLPIVNHANYTQGIRMELCRNMDRPCKMNEIFPFGVTTKCVQKYQYRQLLALAENGQLKREYFSIPTCCVCTFMKM